jgi:hypothetical protein
MFINIHEKKWSIEGKFFSLGHNGLSENVEPTNSERSNYCAIRWKDTSDIGVVPISSISKAPWRARLYGLCTIVNNGQNREGQIIFKGLLNIFCR